jgi:seryl-tRNA synthetase
MRTVYIVSGRPVAKLESGFLVDAERRTVGMDLWCEVKHNEWVPSDKLPPGTLSMMKDRGELSEGIYHEGKLYAMLEIPNTFHRLIASKEGLEKAFREQGATLKDAATFKAQISDPMTQLANKIGELRKKIQELKTLESEERKAFIDSLPARVKHMEKEVRQLEDEEGKEQIHREEEPYTFMDDFARAYSGKTLTTSQLEDVIIGQTIADLGLSPDGKSLLGNAAKMAKLRRMLLQ